MNKLLAQIILAARGDDVEGWMNTLVVVLLVVFWAIGGILKARAKKTKIEDEEEEGKEPFKSIARPSTAKPVYKARGVQARRPEPRRIRADVKKIEPRQAEPSVTGRKAAVAKQARPRFAEAAQSRERLRKPVSAPEKPTIEPLLSADEPDELRRAILHYEILGKPLALREPAEHIIGL